ncbi:MAG: hypothetical protein ACOYNN_17730, partial [Terrimicrobiaceae bacterium]
MTMTAQFEALVRASIRGVSNTWVTDRGLRFSRLPEWTYQQHGHEPGVGKMVERLAGVHLNLLTAATKLTVTYRSERDTNIADGWISGPSTIAVTTEGFEASVSHTNGDLRLWNGEVMQEIQFGEDSLVSFDLPHAEAPRLVQVWLPQNCPIDLIDISGDAELVAAPHSE